jgi:hypothetical protein
MATVKTLDDTVDETNAAIATRADAASVPAATTTAPPGTKLIDPFAAYAQANEGESFFRGDYAKLDQKHGWIRGREKKSIDINEPWVAHVHETAHGWIRYPKFDGDPIRREIALIRECPVLPPCPACGYAADDHDDKECDWRSAIYLPLRSVADSNDVICFTGGGKGARKAVGQLLGIYARPGADRKGRSPTVMLETHSFENQNGGTTTWPRFKIIGWEFFDGTPAPDAQPVAIPIASPAEPTMKALPPKPKRRASDMDDEVPFLIPFVIMSAPVLYFLLSGGLYL